MENARLFTLAEAGPRRRSVRRGVKRELNRLDVWPARRGQLNGSEHG